MRKDKIVLISVIEVKKQLSSAESCADSSLDNKVKSSWTLDWILGFLVVHLLPHHRPADAEEVPQVAQDSSVKRVFLVSAILQVRDPMTWHELPGGAVDGDQVEVAAQQHHHHHRANPDDAQRYQ